MARSDPTIYMRIPQELKDALDAAATENKRSLTAEVVARLEQSFEKNSVSSADVLNASLGYDLATTQGELLRLQRLGTHFAQAAESLIGEMKRSLPDAAEQLQGHLSNLQFFTPLFRTVKDEEFADVFDLQFLMDKRRALLRLLALGDTGDTISYPDELVKVDKKIAEIESRKTPLKATSIY